MQLEPSQGEPLFTQGDRGASGSATSTSASALARALGDVEQFLGRYVVLPRPEAVVAVVLWVAHTHVIEAADATPYLAVSSPEKQSGKTRLLECLSLLTRGDTGILITPTASTIYRTLDASPEARLLIDELDAIFKDRSDRYEEVRAVINAGHRRGATVPRSVSGPNKNWTVKQFAVFGPKALAGIGKLPDTVADRSIPIRMLKRLPREKVEKLRQRKVILEAGPIVVALIQALAEQPPPAEADVPADLPDRAADAWEPLLAIADEAGGTWPAPGRRAASVLHARREQDDSLGLRLLADIKLVFDGVNQERIATADLIAALIADDEAPWGDERFPLSPHRLGRLLRGYEIESKQMRIGARNCKGYERAFFEESWERWLTALSVPTEPQHRNMEPEAGFDVSDAVAPDGRATREPQDTLAEDAYPPMDWDRVLGDDPGHDTWVETEPPEPAGTPLA
jgi:Protein of unknown function (DUF3631)